MIKKVFILFVLLCLSISTCVFATDTQDLPKETLSDLYVSENTYTLDSHVTGNVFSVSTKSFEMSNNSYVSGNIFVVANTVTLKSDAVYSDAIAKDGEFSIDSINSKATVKGNAYIVCKEFTMEPGCEISGDLYIVANSINIKKSVSIGGNIFATTKSFNLNGKVQKSIYVACNDFNMNYYGSITNDLHLTAENAKLGSVIHRNVYIDTNLLETTPDFLLYGNLDVNASTVNFAGEIDGNAKVATKELDFKNLEGEKSLKCIIKGNLDYSTPKELNIKDDIVKGDTNYSVYSEKAENNSSFNIKDFIINLITFVIYVFVVVWLFTLFAKNYSNAKRDITVKNTFIALGIGLLSILAVFVTVILLLLINIGATLAFIILTAYVLVLLLSIPLFVLDIGNLLKGKLSFYLLTLLIALCLFLIGKIPFIGGLVMFLFTITGTGRIIKNILFKK